jgi:hypothetical protein
LEPDRERTGALRTAFAAAADLGLRCADFGRLALFALFRIDPDDLDAAAPARFAPVSAGPGALRDGARFLAVVKCCNLWVWCATSGAAPV